MPTIRLHCRRREEDSLNHKQVMKPQNTIHKNTYYYYYCCCVLVVYFGFLLSVQFDQ